MYPVHANGENDNSYARGAYRLFERGGHHRQPKGFVAGEIRDYVPILRDFTDVLASFVVCRAVRFRSFFGTGVDGMFKICNLLCLHLTPPSLCATSPMAAPHPAMLRSTAREKFKSNPLFICTTPPVWLIPHRNTVEHGKREEIFSI